MPRRTQLFSQFPWTGGIKLLIRKNLTREDFLVIINDEKVLVKKKSILTLLDTKMLEL